MQIETGDYEKLGQFYIGREYDPETRETDGDLLLYDSKDLCTHGVVLGMTGSGKTGLCIALLEEAEIANISASFAPQALVLEPETIRPTRANVRVNRVALLWLPHDAGGRPAW